MSLSSSASAQVQAILEAAENSAAEIKREAEADAEKIRGAARESKQEDLSGVLAAVASLRKDLDALEARLKDLQGPAATPVAPPVAPPEPAA
jgi:vacuolar-type H+-ATPase subunit E/Vma4